MKLPTGLSLTGVHASPAPPARLVCDRSTPHRRAAACRLPPVLLDVRVDRRRSRSAHGYAEALGCARSGNVGTMPLAKSTRDASL